MAEYLMKNCAHAMCFVCGVRFTPDVIFKNKSCACCGKQVCIREEELQELLDGDEIAYFTIEEGGNSVST